MARTESEAEGREDGLLAAARSGDTKAFVEIMRRHDRMLRFVAWQVLGDRDLMDDLLQEVALKAWRALPGFRGDADVGTWLSRLTYHAGVDLLRHRRDERPLAEPCDPDALRIGPERAADPAHVVAERTALHSALAALPPDQRITVILVDREGYDYATVAAVLGVRPGTVASRLSRARAALRAVLSGIDEGETL